VKPTAPLARALVKRTVELRGRALGSRVVIARDLARFWPDSLSVGEFPLRGCVKVYHLLKHALAGEPFGELELSDEPVQIEGTGYAAFPKAFRTLQMMEQLSLLPIQRRPDTSGNAVTEQQVDWVRAWIATHAGPGLPFQVMDEMGTIPPALGVLSLTEVERAFELANSERCEAITGEPLVVADVSAPGYVPQVLRALAVETEIAPEVLMNCHSFAMCLAAADVASELRGDMQCR
jgi:hypothetical protein